jgi:hypothetical protein
MSTVNCPHNPATVKAAMDRVPGMVTNAAAAGKLDPALVPDVQDLMTASLGPILEQQGAGALSNAFSTQLPVAVSGAARRAAATQQTSSVSLPPALGAEDGVLASLLTPPGPARSFGTSWNGVTTDPALRPSFGTTGSGSFFDPLRPAPSNSHQTAVAPALTVAQAAAASSVSATAATSSVAGQATTGATAATSSVAGQATTGATAAELAAFFSGAPAPANDETFWLSEWIGQGQNPLLLPSEIDKARLLYTQVIVPCARYYKQLVYGSLSYPVRIAKILYGITPRKTLRRELRVGPTSRHLLGEAVNFSISGVHDSRVVSDLAAGKIPNVVVGTFAETAGVFASLPFEVEGQRIEGLYLYHGNAIPGFIGYEFTNKM